MEQWKVWSDELQKQTYSIDSIRYLQEAEMSENDNSMEILNYQISSRSSSEAEMSNNDNSHSLLALRLITKYS